MDHCIYATKTCQGMSKIHLTVSYVSHFYVRKYTFWEKCLFEGFVILHFVTHNVSFQTVKKHVFMCRRYCHHAKEVKRCWIEFFFSHFFFNKKRMYYKILTRFSSVKNLQGRQHYFSTCMYTTCELIKSRVRTLINCVLQGVRF